MTCPTYVRIGGYIERASYYIGPEEEADLPPDWDDEDYIPATLEDAELDDGPPDWDDEDDIPVNLDGE